MPESFPGLRVRTPRGLGVVTRVRKNRKRPFLVKIDNADKPYWPLIANVQPIGFIHKTQP